MFDGGPCHCAWASDESLLISTVVRRGEASVDARRVGGHVVACLALFGAPSDRLCMRHEFSGGIAPAE